MTIEKQEDYSNMGSAPETGKNVFLNAMQIAMVAFTATVIRSQK